MLQEKINREIELNVSYDVLDAAVHWCLSNSVRGFVDFKREEPTRATIVYMLSQFQIGLFGKIRIDKLQNELTKMTLFEFREPFSSNEDRKKHFANVIERLFYKLDQENIWRDKQSKNINVGKSVIDSTIVQGDHNKIFIKSSKKSQGKKKS